MKRLQYFILVCLVACWTNLLPGRDRPPDHEVFFIKIPVRIFHQGNAVETLKKSDFQVFLNGQLQPVREMKIVKKTILPEPDTDQNPRLFMLLSSISHHNPEIEKYLEYLFNRVFEINDRLILVFDDGTYRLDNLNHMQSALLKTKRLVIRHGSILNKAKKADAERLEETIDYLRKNAESFSGNDAEFISGGKIHQHYYMKYFKSSLARYLKATQNYIRRYLLPDMNRYRELMAELNHIPGEKWIIHLYQPGMTPRLSKKNRSSIKKMINNLTQRDWTVAWMDEIDNAKQIKKLLADIDNTLNISSQFPIIQLKDLLFNDRWTLNCIFLSDNKEGQSTVVESNQSVHEVKKKWQQLSMATGGRSIEWPLPRSDSHPKVEDMYYELQLNPIHSDPVKKIEIKLSNPGYQVFYSHEIRPGPAPEFSPKTTIPTWYPHINEVDFKTNKLFIGISTHSSLKNRENRKVQIRIRVQIVDNQNRLRFDQQKDLIKIKDPIGITLALEWLEKGKHTVIVEVTDLSTSRSDIQIFQPH